MKSGGFIFTSHTPHFLNTLSTLERDDGRLPVDRILDRILEAGYSGCWILWMLDTLDAGAGSGDRILELVTWVLGVLDAEDTGCRRYWILVILDAGDSGC